MLTDEQRDSLLNSRPERTVTKEQIEANIAGVEYLRTSNQSTLTVAVLTMKNGYTVTGESACAHTGNFDASLGERLAYDNAFKKIWSLEGYLLREALHIEEQKAA
jgi:hypothetical protein